MPESRPADQAAAVGKKRPLLHRRRIVHLPEWLGMSARYTEKRDGFDVQPSKTVWDWLQLLIVPAMLALIAVAYNASQASRQHRRDEAAREDAILLAYFSQMSDLTLQRNLLSRPKGPAAEIARTATLAAVRRMDGHRKAEVVHFLSEDGLLAASAPVVSLSEADLRGLSLVGSSLGNSSLAEADLRGANFDGAWLDHVDFGNADLRGASFRGATLSSVDFTNARLNGASFDRARIGSSPSSKATRFIAACLTNTRFVEAHFGQADFTGAQGHDVNFSAARWTSSLPELSVDVGLANVRGGPTGWRKNKAQPRCGTATGPHRPTVNVAQ